MYIRKNHRFLKTHNRPQQTSAWSIKILNFHQRERFSIPGLQCASGLSPRFVRKLSMRRAGRNKFTCTYSFNPEKRLPCSLPSHIFIAPFGPFQTLKRPFVPSHANEVLGTGKKNNRPNFVLTLLRTPHSPPHFASFLTPLYLNKLDLKDYLWHAYGLQVLGVRSYVIQAKVRGANQRNKK